MLQSETETSADLPYGFTCVSACIYRTKKDQRTNFALFKEDCCIMNELKRLFINNITKVMHYGALNVTYRNHGHKLKIRSLVLLNK